MPSIFDEAQSELNRIDKLQSVEIRTCCACECGRDTDDMKYTKYDNRMNWICNECLTNKED